MNWFHAVPIALVTAAWLLAPGLATSYLVGLRGIAAWALAPVTSIALIAGTAVLAGMIGVDWSIWIVLVVCAVVTALVAAVALALRRRRIFTAGADPRPVTVAAFAGLLPAFVLGGITIVRSIRSPGALSETYDALFHYNALAYIEDSHQASSLTIATFGNADVSGVFYPAAWHDLASLIMMSTGAGIPVAANIVSAVAAVLLWPLSCLLLVRQLFGRNTGALAITGVLSIGFTAFPWDLLGFGVLWPNLLGMALAPAALALVFTITGWTKDDAIGRGRAWLALPVVLLATGLAHPNVVFSVAVLSLFPIAAAIGARGLRLHRAGSTWRGAGEFAAFLAVVGVLWYWAATTPAFALVRETYWPPFGTPANAFGEVALNATNKFEALWLLSAVVITGIVSATRFKVLWLIVAGHLASTFLYVVGAAIKRPDTRMFTGFWYNDPHRLAAMVPITAVPLAVGGIVFLAAKLAARSAENTAPPSGLRGRLRAVPDTYVAIGLVVLLLVLTSGLYPVDRERRVAIGYDQAKWDQLATEDTERFFARIKDEIPEDALVAGNPFNGSAMLWTLADRPVLFPHFRTEHSADQTTIAGHLIEVGTEPAVCAAVRAVGVDYLLVGNIRFRPHDPYWNYYRGLADPGAAPGFELVEADGGNKLYRITACGRAG
ncbi:DUF6541 family protein [Actinophytocola glycyrrhizae]|uniref:DUF6541 family protein n=1 Tax=Actinophytocola glycyrrhizae TaxID=2044873 RepID=A0ABV9RZB9_9PSEU